MSRVGVLALRALSAASLALAPLPAAAAASPLEGLWRTDDGKALVRIAACGQRMCGTIARVLDTGPNVPKTDVNNPDTSRRGRPLVGLQILSGFAGGPAEWKGGLAYDPKSGSSYKSSLRLNADGSLRVTGCVLFVCRSKRWTPAG
jgi:uncharacterized protein (DUF2147 family)